ncbi:MAG: purine-binding chemotaxis protein CheW [Candidatus Omnitrophica bacterium]|nr:purine-binding chemotaxis protein CheW [Candidatus Omnitrophota bacterium]
MNEDNKIIIESEDLDVMEERRLKGVSSIRVLKFILGGENYCVLITQVKEVIRVPDMTHIPMVPSFVKGVMNLRGEIISVMDIREFFGLEESKKALDARIVITDVLGYTVGILVDGVRGTEDIEESSVQAPLATLKKELMAFTKGQVQWGEDIFTLLDLEKVLGFSEIERLRKGE